MVFIGERLIGVLGILYDIHGNLIALDGVLAEAAGVDRWLLGGDYCVGSPWPHETFERLRGLPNATWIRGNGERWLFEPPEDRPEVKEGYDRFKDELSPEEQQWLYDLPPQAEIDGVLYLHGSPLADDESFDIEPREDDERLLAGEHDRTIVFGHSHLQFQRLGPNGTLLVNPGSVGSPRHGEPNAAWAVRRDGGEFELRRTDYDTAPPSALSDPRSARCLPIESRREGIKECSGSSTTCTATSRRSRPCSPTPGTWTSGCSVVTTARSGPGRSRRLRGCASCRTRPGCAVTASAGSSTRR